MAEVNHVRCNPTVGGPSFEGPTTCTQDLQQQLSRLCVKDTCLVFSGARLAVVERSRQLLMSIKGSATWMCMRAYRWCQGRQSPPPVCPKHRFGRHGVHGSNRLSDNIQVSRVGMQISRAHRLSLRPTPCPRTPVLFPRPAATIHTALPTPAVDTNHVRRQGRRKGPERWQGQGKTLARQSTRNGQGQGQRQIRKRQVFMAYSGSGSLAWATTQTLRVLTRREF